MDQIILRAFDREIVEEGSRFVFRKRPLGAVAVALAIFAVAAGLYGLGRWLSSSEGGSGATGLFLGGGAGLLAIVGAIALAGAVYLFCFPARRAFAAVDAAEQTLVVRGRRMPLSDARAFSFVPLSNGMRALSVEVAGGESIPIWIATASQADALRELAARLNEFGAGQGAPAVTVAGAPAAPTTPTAFERRFRSQIIFAMGALWTVGGFFFFRGLSFTSRLDPDGPQVPVWCAGLLILAFGVADWIKARRT